MKIASLLQDRSRRPMVDIYFFVVCAILPLILPAYAPGDIYMLLRGLRIVDGVFIEVVVQGFVLITVVYPNEGDLDQVVRWSLTLVTSTLLIIVEDLGLSVSGLGLTQITQGALQLAIVVCMSCLLVYRRRGRLPEGEAYTLFGRRIGLISLMSLSFICIASLVALVTVPNFTTSPPAFYLTSASGELQGYPYVVRSGSTHYLDLHVTDRGAAEVHYFLMEQVGSSPPEKLANIVLEPGAGWVERMVLPSEGATRKIKLSFSLVNSASEETARELWIYYRIITSTG